MNQRITSNTKLTALLGYPVKQSLSALMHNTAFGHLNLDYIYIPFDIEQKDLQTTVAGLKTLNFTGFNLTMPHKQEIIQYLDEISKEAKLIGAVNTVVKEKGRLIGYNTDGKGYIASLKEEKIPVKNQKVVMVGSGGAAKSIAIQLAMEGVEEILLLNRTIKPAEEIADTIIENISGCHVKAREFNQSNLQKVLEKANILINCTPLGMYSMKDSSIVEDERILRKDLVVSDLVYNPEETKLLRQGKNRGCKTINGLGMLIWQGALAFKVWTGEDMPVDVVREKMLSR